MAASTVPGGVASEALAYLAAGGADNLRELHRFLCDTVLLTGEGFAPPAPTPEFGVHGDRIQLADRPTVGIVFYRAHELSGNTAFVDALCDAVEARGANALPVFCGSLRGAPAALLDVLGRADALVATVLAAGGAVAATAGAGGDDEAWDAGALAELDVPVLQGLCLTTSRATWAASDAALSPMDAAMQVAIPEFDGRAGHRAVLVQGDGSRRRPARLPRRSGADGAAGGARGATRAATAHPGRRAAPGDRAVVVPDQARPRRQRRGAGHARFGRAAADGAAGRGLHGGRLPDRLRRAHPHAHRGGRSRRRMAHRGAVGRRAPTGGARRLPGVARGPADGRRRDRALGPAAGVALRRRRGRTRPSCSRPCASGTCC